jgi:hypothetical protein
MTLTIPLKQQLFQIRDRNHFEVEQAEHSSAPLNLNNQAYTLQEVQQRFLPEITWSRLTLMRYVCVAPTLLGHPVVPLQSLTDFM